MKLTFRVSVVVIAVLLSCASPAFPQESGFQPLPGGLFGASETRTARQSLDVSFSVAEAYDRDVPPELRRLGAGDALVGGASTMFMGRTGYRFEGSRVQVEANGESSLRHYNQLAALTPFSYSGGIGVLTRLGGRTTLQADQTAAYSPSYLYGLFPGTADATLGNPIPAAPDYAASDFGSFTYGTAVALTQGLTTRSRFSARGELKYTDFENATLRGVSSEEVGGEYSHNLALRTAVQIGYDYRTGTLGFGGVVAPGASATEHRMLVGFKHSRQLSATRSLMFAAEFGSSLITPSSSADGADPRRRYLPSADVAVAWQFSDGWQARGAFQRGLQYIPVLSEPVFANGFTADLSGLLTSRLDCVASARYTSGASPFNGDSLAFDSYGADVRVRFAVSRTLAIYGGYLYYFYDFPPGALAPGIPPGLERTGIRVGLTVWVPAVRR